MLSMSLTIIFIYPFLRFIETSDSFYLYLGLGTLLTDILTKIIKGMTSGLGQWFQRPKGATKCDIMCVKGSAEGMPGFPSGHMAVTTFFFAMLYVHTGQNTNVAICGLISVFLMGCARYIKLCHSLFQIIAGIIVGIAMAFQMTR